jgi:hypothetical protein
MQMNTQQLQEKWSPVLDHEALPKITDRYKRAVTAVLLENQETAIRESRIAEGNVGLLTEASPANNAAGSNTGRQLDTYDPVLISLVRRSAPNLIAYDICGVQPMSGPTGLIFAMKSNYVLADGQEIGAEALFNEAQTPLTASDAGDTVAGVDNATTAHTDPFHASDNYGSQTSGGMTTAKAEALGGTTADNFREMAFTIEKTSVTAKSRALKAEYTTELAQDLKAVHGLDAESELSNILSTEILAEINREIIRRVLTVAKLGALNNTTTDGTFDLDTDSNGRWSVEKFKGLHFQIERDANVIAVETRRGRGNIIIASADVVAALSMTGSLDTSGSVSGGTVADDGITGNTLVGTLNGKYKVYVDPYYSATDQEFIMVGYKGSSPYDAGLFYCPYVPLQMVRATGEQTFQPKIGFKTRYGLVSNPFVEASAGTPDQETLTAGTNQYYRKFRVSNLM